MGEVTTVICPAECNPQLGHALHCERHTERYAATDPRAKLRAKVDGVLTPGDEPAAVETRAARMLPAAPARDDRRFQASLAIFLARKGLGAESSRAMAAECVDEARMLISEVDRDGRE